MGFTITCNPVNDERHNQHSHEQAQQRRNTQKDKEDEQKTEEGKKESEETKKKVAAAAQKRKKGRLPKHKTMTVPILKILQVQLVEIVSFLMKIDLWHYPLMLILIPKLNCQQTQVLYIKL